MCACESLLNCKKKFYIFNSKFITYTLKVYTCIFTPVKLGWIIISSELKHSFQEGRERPTTFRNLMKHVKILMIIKITRCRGSECHKICKVFSGIVKPMQLLLGDGKFYWRNFMKTIQGSLGWLGLFCYVGCLCVTFSPVRQIKSQSHHTRLQ